ncbi:MAG TPA: hypothetical protein VET25_01845 [Aestuariivirgaceae bacterium]|nr:hypothetical protein [Aestuariivirgaceae bacterium]
MRMRMVKSPEEIAHITKMAKVADLGGAACVEAIAPGVAEHGSLGLAATVSTTFS